MISKKNYLLLSYILGNQLHGGKKSNQKKWTTFEHNGVLFVSEYESHNIPVYYENKPIKLNSLAEEAATLYARYYETDYPKSATFRRNFWKDWKKLLGKDTPIKDLKKCNFSYIYKFILEEKEKKKAISKEEKKRTKEKKDKSEEKYKFALVDGKKQPVGNFRVEPPGIFIGRGCHPKLGKLKKRIYPIDITLNLSKKAYVPIINKNIPEKKRKWGNIVHDDKSEWLASWKEVVTGKTKYVWLSAKSEIKGRNDLEKYELARKLKKKIGAIKKKYYLDMESNNKKIRQIATSVYFIDNLALRVGNEKSKDEADTVGVASLRIEHIILKNSDTINLNFLSKDSVRYIKDFKVIPIVFNNIRDFLKGKNQNDQLFDKISPQDINNYLQELLPGLTSKVFRTFNASSLFQKELNKIKKKYDTYSKDTQGEQPSDLIDKLLDEFNKANAKVAILCNHQKDISKNFKSSIKKMKKKISELKNKKKELIDKKTVTEGKKKKKIHERIKKISLQIAKEKIKKNLKMELKNISLGTSKINYIDPRITVSFMNHFNLPINKLFSKTLQEKFTWALKIKEFQF